jgi:hypothetical protein
MTWQVRAISNRWLGVETIVPLPLSELVLPSAAPAHTELLDLRPLPKSAVANPEWESLFKFSHFNPVQTQVHASFHSVCHTVLRRCGPPLLTTPCCCHVALPSSPRHAAASWPSPPHHAVLLPRGPPLLTTPCCC